MNINLLIFGDIFGKPGREILKKHLPKLKKKYEPDLTVANIENLAHGKGFTENTVKELSDMGIDAFTSGNHVWHHKGSIPLLDRDTYAILRPANYPPHAPGRGWQIIHTKNKKKVLIINLMGRVFMGSHLDCPFRTADAILEETASEKPDAIIIDLHAEATSEKTALAHYLDGRISLLYGTHTHVPTADARILKGGTAYISDVGLSGPLDSVIGVKKEIAIKHFLTQLPAAHEVAEGETTLNAISCTINTKTGHATSIHLIQDQES